MGRGWISCWDGRSTSMVPASVVSKISSWTLCFMIDLHRSRLLRRHDLTPPSHLRNSVRRARGSGQVLGCFWAGVAQPHQSNGAPEAPFPGVSPPGYHLITHRICRSVLAASLPFDSAGDGFVEFLPLVPSALFCWPAAPERRPCDAAKAHIVQVGLAGRIEVLLSYASIPERYSPSVCHSPPPRLGQILGNYHLLELQLRLSIAP